MVSSEGETEKWIGVLSSNSFHGGKEALHRRFVVRVGGIQPDFGCSLVSLIIRHPKTRFRSSPYVVFYKKQNRNMWGIRV